jgi:uncharacterized protein YggE
MPWPLARVATLALLTFVSLALVACGKSETLLTVHANATTRTAPDLAIVTLGVVARGASASAAQQAQSARMSAIMTATRAAGVEDSDVQTVGFSLDPQYVYRRGESTRIGGYISRNTISIRVRDLSKVSTLIDAAVADGANELQGIQFTFIDEEASRDAARAKAVETARSRAAAYAEAAGMRVRRIVSITEPGGAPAPWVGDGAGYGDAFARAAAVQSASISPGQLDNRSSVTVVFELR